METTLQDLYPPVMIPIGALLMCLISRANDIMVCLKKGAQRTTPEKMKWERGLGRSLLLEFLIFAPASALLMFLLSPLILGMISPLVFKLANTDTLAESLPGYTIYTLLGTISYGFPFAAIKRIFVKTSIRILKDFVNENSNNID